jgi:uncharacterized membrane protein YdjX (TVP38/TMEM64 family)
MVAQVVEIITSTGFFGMIFYVFITAIAVVIAPISTFPLIPIASIVWGYVVAAILSIIGWTIGAQIAFIIARRFGKPLVQKFISLEKLESFEKRIPEKNLFWSIVVLRMTVPVDILSYALGLFSKISYSKYFWATIIGVTPFAFIFSYIVTFYK